MNVELPTANDMRAVVREELERALGAAPARREWVSQSELADYLGVSRYTVAKMVREGRIEKPRRLADKTYRFHIPTVSAALLDARESPSSEIRKRMNASSA